MSHPTRHNDNFAPSGVTPLSICYSLAAFPVLSETFVTNEIRAMRRMGHTIVPVALRPHDGPCQPEDEPMRAEAIQLGDIPMTRALAFAAAHPAGMAAALRFANRQTGLPVRSLIHAAARVAYTARRQGCTHIHAHFAHSSAATAITAALLAGMTCSFIGHGYDIYGTPCDLPVKLAAADVVFATCEDMVADFRRLAPTVNAVMASCGIDPNRIVPARDELSNGRLLAIGRLVEQKGYSVLIDALGRMPADARPMVDVVGVGALGDALKAQAAEAGLGDTIRFLGSRSAEWIAAEGPHYQGFLAPYVICGDSDRDTGPVAVKEALAMGLPVVASYLMGLKESVQPSNGRHVEPGDAGALAEAIVWLARLTGAQRQALGGAGRRHALANYTLDAQAARMTDAIRAVQSRGAASCAA